ncbi:MAG: hypothetical protein ACYC91_05330 [Solirubrobacteraceae bacterium]
MRIRRVPQLGGRVTVVYLASRVGGVVEQVADDLRRLTVLTDDGERIGFQLSQATASFLSTDGSHARLLFDSDGYGSGGA